MDEIDIGRITIKGKLTKEERAAIKKRFKRVWF
jgi:hypothetical protein